MGPSGIGALLSEMRELDITGQVALTQPSYSLGLPRPPWRWARGAGPQNGLLEVSVPLQAGPWEVLGAPLAAVTLHSSSVS